MSPRERNLACFAEMAPSSEKDLPATMPRVEHDSFHTGDPAEATQAIGSKRSSPAACMSLRNHETGTGPASPSACMLFTEQDAIAHESGC